VSSRVTQLGIFIRGWNVGGGRLSRGRLASCIWLTDRLPAQALRAKAQAAADRAQCVPADPERHRVRHPVISRWIASQYRKAAEVRHFAGEDYNGTAHDHGHC
jgi:hypothetical protein